MTALIFEHVVGASVEARDPSTGAWRPATIERHEPYQGRPGYRVAYSDATEQWHCHSGWQPEHCVRVPESHAARERMWDRMTQHSRLQTGIQAPCTIPFGPMRISCEECGAKRGDACVNNRKKGRAS